MSVVDTSGKYKSHARPPGYTPVLGLRSVSATSRSSGLVTVRIVVLATVDGAILA